MSATVVDIQSVRRRSNRGAAGPRPVAAGAIDPVVVARRCAAGEQLLTTAELCRTVRVSDREVRRWRKADPAVPCVPVTDRHVRWFLADVLAWRAGRTDELGQAS